MDGPQAEAYLIALWQRTFANVAAVQEAWMEDAFIRRGRAIFDTVYPDGDERERLYRYGSTPYVGRRFERIAPQVKQLLANAVGYGDTDEDDRQRQWQRVHLERHPRLGGSEPRRMALHCARQADAEWLHRELQRPTAR